MDSALKIANLKRQCELALRADNFSRADAKAAASICARVFLGDTHTSSDASASAQPFEDTCHER